MKKLIEKVKKWLTKKIEEWLKSDHAPLFWLTVGVIILVIWAIIVLWR